MLSSFALADTYPKIDISGYKKWEYKEVQVNPQSNYFLGLTQLGGYSPTVTGGPWQERLQLKILAQLSEKLAVTYDIEQQPESPDRYDIKVSYDNRHELTFGDFTATYSGNEFASTTKYLNGMLLTSKDEGYEIIAVPSAKLKSQIQGLTSQKGNNSRGPYSLGHGSIVENSERIELNNILLTRGTDYIIDYFEGKVSFTRILTADDEFKYSYEYTNLIDLFFPTLSKKDFFGLQGRFKLDPTSWGKKTPVPFEVIVTTSESFPEVYEEQVVITLTTAEAEKQARISALTERSDKLEAYLKSLEAKLADARKKKDAKRIKLVGGILTGTRKEYLDLQDKIASARLEPVIEEGAPSGEAASIAKLEEERAREEEASGRYQLNNYPIVPFSENLTFRGATLRKDVDYSIKYDTGRITLLLPNLPSKSDPLSATYNYKKVEEIEELLPGTGGRGPYNLTNRHVVPLSERIYLNERLIVRDYDYTIDYATSSIVFNYDVPLTASIKVRYRYTVMEMPPPPPAPKFPTSLVVGGTYLRESAKAGAGSSTTDYSEPTSFKYADIIAADNTLYLTHFPLVPTGEGGVLVLTMGGTALTYGVDYVVPSVEADIATGYAKVTPPTKLAFINDRTDLSDGYDTGTIKILTTLPASAEIYATYTYSKGVVGRYSGVGNGSQGPYYIRNYRNLIAGSERIEVWETGSSDIKTYTRNSSFEIDAGDQGYSINYYKENPYITFNAPLGTNMNYSIYFQNVPASTTQQNDIVQEVAGMDLDFKVGEVFKAYGNVASSRTDKVIVSVTTTETPSFTPPTNRVYLVKHNTPAVVENTEQVYVNGYLRNRDADYSIDYTTGTISFYYITLTTADAVSVTYDYPDPAGIAKVGANTDTAFKYGVAAGAGPVSASYNQKKIGSNFNPLGGTAIGVGSNYMDFSGAYNPQFHGLNAGYTFRETDDPQSRGSTLYNRSFDRNYSLSLNPWELAQMGLNIRNVEMHEDVAGGGNFQKSETNDYSGSLTPRSLRFHFITYDQRYDGRLTDSEDFVNRSWTRNKYFHASQSMGLTERLKLGADYQISEPYTISKHMTTEESKTSWSSSKDLSYDASLDLTFAWVQRWTAYAKTINHQAWTYLPTLSQSIVNNQTYHTDLTPFSNLSGSYDYSLQEQPSVVVGQKNPKTERSSTNLRYNPMTNLTLGWGNSKDSTIHETARESSGNSETYTADWNVINTEKFKFDARARKYNRNQVTPAGTAESVSDIDTVSQDYTFALIPLSILTITPGFSQEEYKNIVDGAPVDAQSQTLKMQVTFTPIPRFNSRMDYANKLTSSAGVGRPKYNLGAVSTLRVFDWGELVHNIDQEHNKGEVLAGGTIPELNYFKCTNTFTLRFTIPQDNPIISALVLSASAKFTNYDNQLTGRDTEDLNASMYTFEGTLNF